MVQRWWHAVDGARAARCQRPDAHSKGACDAFKSRAFLPAALVEGEADHADAAANAIGRGSQKRKVGWRVS